MARGRCSTPSSRGFGWCRSSGPTGCCPMFQTWHSDPAIFEMVQTEYKRGIYRGIGEFHIHGKAAAGELVKKLVDFAVEHDLYLHAHGDEEALLILFRHNPRAKVIWAHTGFSTPPARIAQLLIRYPALWGELSYHSGIVDGAGRLAPGYRAWLAQLPPEHARNIAHANAERLFGGKIGE